MIVRTALAALLLLVAIPAQAQQAPPCGKVSTCNTATLPLLGGEWIYVVQNGASRKAPISAVPFSGNLTQANIAPPPNSLTPGLTVTQTVATTSSSIFGFSLNSIIVNSDIAALTSGAFGVAFNVAYVVGKTGDPTNSALVQGGREAIQAQIYLVNPTSPSNSNRNYVAAQHQGVAQTGDNGTDWQVEANAKGAIFGHGSAVYALSGATNLLDAASAEHNTFCNTGSSGFLCTGLTIVDTGTGGNWKHRTAIDVGAVPGAHGYDTVLYLSTIHGGTTLTSTGCIICTDGVVLTAGSGIDVSNYIFANYVFRSANMQITPDGIYAAWNGSSTMGSVRVVGGDATHTGHFDWYAPNGTTRYAQMGFDTGAGVTLALQNSGIFNITGLGTVAAGTGKRFLCIDPVNKTVFEGTGATCV